MSLRRLFSFDDFESAIDRRERALTVAILAMAALLQMNGIFHHGYMGQDFGFHAEAAARAARMPPFRWIVYAGANPPALYWISGLASWTTGSKAYIAVASFVLVGLNILALYIWTRMGRAAIRRPILRVAALLALAFLPVRVVHSTVFAADAVAVLPFTLVPWLVYELFRVPDPGRQIRLLVALVGVLLAGLCAKYTMASALPVALGILLLMRRDLASRRVLASALILLVLVPGFLAVQQYRVYARLPSKGVGHQRWAHEMDWRSLLAFRAADVDVLHAPRYMEEVTVNGARVRNLLTNNRHSYPALLHLSMFTDILDIFQNDPSDSYFGARDSDHQKLMTVAVNWAIPLSLLMIAATIAYTFRALSYLRRRRLPRATDSDLPALLVLAFSLAFFANIALFLPSMQYAYLYGYWLGRLVLPALLGFCLLAFAFLDGRLRSSAARVTVLAYAAAQAALHASFLWVRGP